MAVVGLAVGFVAALVTARWLSATVHGVAEWDPVAFGGTAAVVVLAAFLASYLPAARAARVDPMEALRAE